MFSKLPPFKPQFYITIFVAFIALVISTWFVFGWLYGPNPRLSTIPSAIQSYLEPRKNITIPNQLNDSLINANADLSFLKLPKGFEIQEYSSNLGGLGFWVPGVNWGVRQMTHKNDTIYVTLHKEGQVVALVNKSQEIGQEIEKKTFLHGLSLPNGIEVYGDWIYVAENDKIIRVKDADSDGVADSQPEKILDLPPFLEHWTRTVRIFEDKIDQNRGQKRPFMFVAIGSSCSSCVESNPWRASIIRCETDGKDCRVYASGLRNSVDFTNYKDQIFATEAGKDFVGNELVPDEINRINDSKNYGWPYCYGKQVHDTTFDQLKNPCPETEPSFVDIPAHSTPIGITGYEGDQFPDSYKESLYVAEHGSYQSSPATGYKVTRIDKNGNKTDFLTGFINEKGGVKGRPTSLHNYKGGLLLSDDMKGKIYFIQYQG